MAMLLFLQIAYHNAEDQNKPGVQCTHPPKQASLSHSLFPSWYYSQLGNYYNSLDKKVSQIAKLLINKVSQGPD